MGDVIDLKDYQDTLRYVNGEYIFTEQQLVDFILLWLQTFMDEGEIQEVCRRLEGLQL
jgi:hypothetical protein